MTAGRARVDRPQPLWSRPIGRRDQPLDEGFARLREALTEPGELPLRELCDRLIARLRPGGPEDDVAPVAIRLHRPDTPRPPEAGPAQVPPGVPPE